MKDLKDLFKTSDLINFVSRKMDENDDMDLARRKFDDYFISEQLDSKLNFDEWKSQSQEYLDICLGIFEEKYGFSIVE